MFSQTFSSLNWLHILVATIAYFFLGAIWYSALFTKQWIALHKIDVNAPDAKKGVAVIMIGGFLLTILIVAGIAFLQPHLAVTTFAGGVKLGALVSVCFSATSLAMNYLYLKKPLGLYVIDCGYHIAGCCIAGAILGTWH
jgi:hypothetical protein